ncbi:M50 family metallopeptidase [Ruania alba]|uniref:Membrane-associated protease RseP, regulator of RpoE activity n=1 Tax=Ruania alba TaxID=648782 RepID=A0A1H5E2D9_9MICO|nr:M50 family metallopeptidase [Ruania alba]SED85214.1 Membrane-associated protease RseP, regulator of RpoE activity [Ruania alba]
MDFWWGVLVIAFGLIVSIALHEIGHLVPAKLFKVKVTQYFVGFGRTLWSTRRGDTEYGIKMLPLGGYVRMIGMFPPAREQLSDDARYEAHQRRRGLRGTIEAIVDDTREASGAEVADEIRPGDGRKAFYQLTMPRKLAVMFGGPVMNLIISTVLFAVIFTGLGIPTWTNRVAAVSECVLPAGESRECTADDPVAPAAEAGLLDGDEVVSWAGHPVEDWEDLTAAIDAGGATEVEVVVLRDGDEVALSVTPTLVERPVTDAQGQTVLTEQPFVGINASRELQPEPITAVPGHVWQVFTGTVEIVLTLPQRLVSIAQSTFGGTERDPNVVGLIGVGRMGGEVTSSEALTTAEQSAVMLNILASLNMALFVFNMVPLLPLDGGHIAGALFEGIRRRLAALTGRKDPGPADTAKLMPVTYVVVVLLAGMSIMLAIADIVNPVTLF